MSVPRSLSRRVCFGAAVWGGVLTLCGSLGAQVEQWRGGRVAAVLPTLQAAVDAARPGDVLRVRAGVYHENVRIAGKRAGREIRS